MAQEIDDLNAAIADLSTTITDAETDINAQAAAILAASSNGDAAAVEAGVAQIKTLTAGLRAAITPVVTAAAAVPPATP